MFGETVEDAGGPTVMVGRCFDALCNCVVAVGHHGENSGNSTRSPGACLSLSFPPPRFARCGAVPELSGFDCAVRDCFGAVQMHTADVRR